MATSADTLRLGRSGIRKRPAAAAAAHVFAAKLGLGALGLVSLALVLVRLCESWRVSPRASAHHVAIFGYVVGYPTANVDAIVVLVLALVALAATVRGLREAARQAFGAVRLHRRLARRRCGEFGDALLIADDRPLAFCAGFLRPRIYLSTGASALLDELAVEAVLAHERHHARHRDPLRAATGCVLSEALFFVPGIRELARRHRALAELSADEHAVHASPANRAGLARAMLSFCDVEDERIGFDQARVDYLLGASRDWSFPALVCAVATAVLAVLIGVGVLAGRVAAGSATLAPPFLSRQPCIVALAVLAAALALGAASCGRRLRAALAG